MKFTHPQLAAPIYFKFVPGQPWPEDEPFFYYATGNGLFLCRNNPFFRSSVPVDRLPGGLSPHEATLKLNFPRLTQINFERVIGFFSMVAARHTAEAAVILAWNTETSAIELIVPEQTSYVSQGWSGKVYPVEVHYETPDLPPHLLVFGDIHSHVYDAAYSSWTDKEDETHRPGIHLVVGRLNEEPPEFHAEVTVDGKRFRVTRLEHIVEGYRKRRCDDVPSEWFDRVVVKPWSNQTRQKIWSGSSWNSTDTASASHGRSL
jgi:hypothetical protein